MLNAITLIYFSLAIMMIGWGYLNITDSPYGFPGKVMGGIQLVYGTWMVMIWTGILSSRFNYKHAMFLAVAILGVGWMMGIL